ncbi:MAG: GH39 family glycosyl hydrolase [Erysipelotrichaceae bacterium]
MIEHNATYEHINYTEKQPYRVFLSNVQHVQNHWHNSFEIILVISGSAKINIGSKTSVLQELDFAFINSCYGHSVLSDEGSLLLTLQISRDILIPLLGEHLEFKVKDNATAKALLIKHLAEIAWVYHKKGEYYQTKLQALLYDLIYVLQENYSYETNKQTGSEKYNERIESIIRYINAHYAEEISLQDISDKEFLSIAYVSKFFKKYVGVSYKQYISSVRLEHAIHDLIHTDLTIQELATKNGFPTVKSLSRELHKIYNMSLSDFRKKNKMLSERSSVIKRAANYTELTHSDAFASLFQYLDTPDVNHIPTRSKDSIAIKLNDYTPIPFTHYWKNLTSVGKAAHLMRRDVQEQLLLATKELGFTMVKFHGIFDDSMMVLCKISDGQPQYNFNYIFQIFDFLFDHNIKPFVSLNFMPKLLAKHPKPYFFDQSYPCMPKENAAWCDLLTEFIQALISRFGLACVQTLQFELWNEPELTNAFWDGSDKDFHEFWKASVHAIKAVHPSLQVGGPSISNVDDIVHWLHPFLDFCKAHDCMPDFFSYHVYPHCDSMDELSRLLIKGKKSPVISKNIHHLATSVQFFQNLLAPYGFHYDNIFINEWNASASHDELTNDTCYKACYIVKQLVENINKVKYLNHWTLTDIMEEFPLAADEFHGGLGLITQHGIKKAAYHAYALMNCLGDELITKTSNYIITKSLSGYQILCFNYAHFDDMYCNNDRSHISKQSRYQVFQTDCMLHLQLILELDYCGPVVLTKHTLDREHGSTYDSFNQYATRNTVSKEDIQYLQSIHPSIEKKRIHCNQTIELDVALPVHGIQLFTITF